MATTAPFWHLKFTGREVNLTFHSFLLADNAVELNQIPGWGGFVPDNPDSTGSTITQLFSTVFGFLTIVAGLAFALYFVLGGLNWIVAGGDETRVEKAKNQMTNAAVGLIVVVAAYAIIGIVGNVLGVDILNFQSFLNSDTIPGN